MAVVDRALQKQGITTKAVEWWKGEMPVEQEMVPKDKYTIFDRKEKKYRKSIRSKFSGLGIAMKEGELMILQSCRSGPECHNESILLDTDRMYWYWDGCKITILPRKHHRKAFWLGCIS